MSSSLQDLIERACSASRYDPNLKLNLQICEMINKRQGSAPRTAAVTIVKLVNSPRTNQAMLALNLLDNCVKKCGYPFHLQIATKEFLNALVRRFPERPPSRYAPSPVQSSPENQWNHFDFIPQKLMAHPVLDRILYLIKEWKIALTELSRYKEDMTHIRDMYRLLKFKGYAFPELRDSSMAALAPVNTLKSIEELEEEDRVAQAAKLQELIRREELQKIKNKARLLYEMLDNLKQGDKIDETMKELNNACENAIPKIENMLKQEEDTEKIEEMNEAILIVKNSILKYQDLQKGQYNTNYDINGKYDSKLEEHTQPISLIDLGDDLSNHISTSGSSSPAASAFDLLSTSEALLPSETKLIDMVNKNGLAIQLETLSAKNNDNTLQHFKAYYSNKSTAPMDNMNLLLAAPKTIQKK
ncbi:hypothetical protein RO3G_02890 [Rhizopus delemar RA 99-880]|uniref:VHS domain-containing protein n=1 Tax=Rhizopus delemar (strain RA 99-880 / ATCC MYA-4621 / FGSC 9543 / NRRL 43880) TaxID=246409 RepID=I1BPQ6_RHIO9|nr:hypothetical protein RO3G_02890 [Rhizopus delemar RA 99-880]|eukprot:EIE78186.1 hypothetical protein RO3G_02890 [Rhizopus delemar RA 99-880]